jgi:hypothetical protein
MGDLENLAVVLVALIDPLIQKGSSRKTPLSDATRTKLERAVKWILVATFVILALVALLVVVIFAFVWFAR